MVSNHIIAVSPVHRTSVIFFLIDDSAELLPTGKTEFTFSAPFIMMLDDPVSDFQSLHIRT